MSYLMLITPQCVAQYNPRTVKGKNGEQYTFTNMPAYIYAADSDPFPLVATVDVSQGALATGWYEYVQPVRADARSGLSFVPFEKPTFKYVAAADFDQAGNVLNKQQVLDMNFRVRQQQVGALPKISPPSKP